MNYRIFGIVILVPALVVLAIGCFQFFTSHNDGLVGRYVTPGGSSAMEIIMAAENDAARHRQAIPLLWIGGIGSILGLAIFLGSLGARPALPAAALLVEQPPTVRSRHDPESSIQRSPASLVGSIFVIVAIVAGAYMFGMAPSWIAIGVLVLVGLWMTVFLRH